MWATTFGPGQFALQSPWKSNEAQHTTLHIHPDKFVGQPLPREGKAQIKKFHLLPKILLYNNWCQFISSCRMSKTGIHNINFAYQVLPQRWSIPCLHLSQCWLLGVSVPKCFTSLLCMEPHFMPSRKSVWLGCMLCQRW